MDITWICGGCKQENNPERTNCFVCRSATWMCRTETCNSTHEGDKVFCDKCHYNKDHTIRKKEDYPKKVQAKLANTHSPISIKNPHSTLTNQEKEQCHPKDMHGPTKLILDNHVERSYVGSVYDMSDIVYNLPLNKNRSIKVIHRQEHDERESRKKVETILEVYEKEGKPYIDEDFPHESKSLFHPEQTKPNCWKWRRLSHSGNVGMWTVYDNPDSTDICQGKLNNCWFLSALAVVATRKDLLERIILTKEYNEAGVYCIRLCSSGQWQVVVIDEYVPHEDIPTCKPVYCTTQRQQLWGSLIEKAAAKLHRRYSNLILGRCIEALSLLTGEPCEYVRCKDPNSEWNLLEKYHKQGFLICSSCISEENGVGLVTNHAYSVLDVREITNRKNEKYRLIQLRNPWGKQSWNGKWCDRSLEWLLVDEKTKNNLNPTRNNQGIFWMNFNDFYKHFENFDICKARHNQHELRFSGTYPNEACQHWKLYQLAVLEKTKYDIGLFQRNKRHESLRGENLIDQMLLVLHYDYNPFKVNRVCKRTRWLMKTYVGFEIELDVGEYLIAGISLKNYNRPECKSSKNNTCFNTEYTLTLHSQSTIQVESVEEQFNHVVTDALILVTVENNLKRETSANGVYLYEYIDDCFVFVVENSSTFWCKITFDFHKEYALYSRNSQTTIDWIPPMSRQIAQVVIPIDKKSHQFQSSQSAECFTISQCILHEQPHINSNCHGNNDFIHEPRPIMLPVT